MHASGTASPAYFYAKSLALTEQTLMPDVIVDSVFEYLASERNGTNLWAITFDGLGEALGDVAPTDTAFVHRDALYFIFSFSRTSGDVTDTTVRFLDGLSELVTSAHPGAFYGEYAGNVDWRQANDKARLRYYGQNLARLEDIKAELDPTDVFHNKQSVHAEA